MSEKDDLNKLICFCMTVTRGEIVEAIRDGHDSIEKLKQEVGCSTGCGTCVGRVQAILEEASEDTDEKSADSPAPQCA